MWNFLSLVLGFLLAVPSVMKLGNIHKGKSSHLVSCLDPPAGEPCFLLWIFVAFDTSWLIVVVLQGTAAMAAGLGTLVSVLRL
jgi:hypothetical protein